MTVQDKLPLEPLIGGTGGRYRWVSITSLLLSAGVIIKLVTPSIAGITPNWLIAMYCLAIILSRPTLKQSFVIGIVTGCMGLGLSKSALPLANFLSEPAGAVVAWFLAKIPFSVTLNQKKIDLRPSLVVFSATTVSGGIFVTTLYLALGIPTSVYLYAMIPTVLIVALVNMICAQVVYLPARRLFSRLSGEEQKGTFDRELGPQIDSEEDKSFEGIILDRCSYSFDGKQRALDEVSLRIDPGSFAVIVGASGSGKTTLSAAFAGLIPHIYGGYGAGRIIVKGKANRQESLAERAKVVGLVMEDVSSQLVAMTVGEEVAFALENQELSELEIEKRVTLALEQVRLAGLEARQVTQLSGGQRQRLVIAAALAQETPILVLDEPASALDPEGREEIYNLLGELHQSRRGELTFVILETEIAQGIQYATHLGMMEKGELKVYGKLEDSLQKIGQTPSGRKLLPQILQIRSKLEEKGFTPMKGQSPLDLGLEIQEQLVSPREVY